MRVGCEGVGEGSPVRVGCEGVGEGSPVGTSHILPAIS